MKEYEKEIVSIVKGLVVNGIKSLSGYSNPFTKVAEAVIAQHNVEIREILNDCLKDVLSDGEFKAEIRKAIGQKVVREFANQAESCISRTVQKLKQDETFRARLTLAVDNLLKEYDKR
jgi:hypothetical protein